MNPLQNSRNEDQKIRVDLIRDTREKLLIERSEITSELKRLDEEEEKLIPNVVLSLKERSREDNSHDNFDENDENSEKELDENEIQSAEIPSTFGVK